MTTKLTAKLTDLDLAPAGIAVITFYGLAFDVRGCDGIIRAFQSARTPDDDNLVGVIQDSPDGLADWKDITTAMFVEVNSANSPNFQSLLLPIDRTRGWIRYAGNVGGTSPQVILSANAVVFDRNRT